MNAQMQGLPLFFLYGGTSVAPSGVYRHLQWTITARHLQEHRSSSHGVDTQSLVYGFVKYGTASGLVHPLPKLGPQFTVLLGHGWGSK